LEGKRLFLERDGQDSSFLYDFFIGYGPQFYVYHLQYEDEGGRKNILSYKFAPRGGIGAVIQGTSLGIDDSKDSIVVFYDTEPEDGFVIDSSYIVNNLADFWSFVMQIIFCIALIVTAVLLLLDLFSAKFKLVQNKVWIYFAAIGILPCIPLALFGALILGNVLLGGLWR
jgi:hypothetical protein